MVPLSRAVHLRKYTCPLISILLNDINVKLIGTFNIKTTGFLEACYAYMEFLGREGASARLAVAWLGFPVKTEQEGLQ